MSNRTYNSMQSWVQSHREIAYLLLCFVYLFLLFLVTFHKETFFTIFLFTAKLFYLFALPGYCLLLHKRKDIPFATRLVVGIALQLALLLIASYYLGILGVHIRYHHYILPPLSILLGLLLYWYRSSEK
ncbi:hypothetical protein HYS48_02310 [Candidatus Woesearchaeota archaeon]|nr:hypothetical protein [Candidatus Woesearchaeota archaeon]